MGDTEEQELRLEVELGMKAKLGMKEMELSMKEEEFEKEEELEKKAELIDMVLTCQENIDDPNIGQYLESLTLHLEQLVSNAHKVTVKKVEPWNSIRVTLNITREAAEHLRRLAELGDQSLLDLGILSVQVDEDRIVLRTGSGKDSSEIVLTTGARSRPTTQPENCAGAIADGVQGTRTETMTQSVASAVGGSSSLAMANQNLMSESESLKREFDQYMNGLIHGRINCVGGGGSSAPGGNRNRELSESDWDAMRDVLYPNELLSPERHAAPSRQRHDTSPRAMSHGGNNSFPPGYHHREACASSERINDFARHEGFIGGLNQEQQQQQQRLNMSSMSSSSWNEVPLTYGDIRRVMNPQMRLREYPAAAESNSGQLLDGGLRPDTMMQMTPDGVVAPKKRKRVRKPKALKDTTESEQLTGLTAESDANRDAVSRVCKKEGSVSLSQNRGTDRPGGAGGVTNHASSSSPLKILSNRREPIVNPVTGLLEPDGDRNAEEDSVLSSSSQTTTTAEVDRCFYDEAMFPLVNLHPPPNPLVALHSRIIANQNQALTSSGALSPAAAAAHRFPYPPASGAPRFSPPPHNDGFQQQQRHLLAQSSVEKSVTGPSPRKRARSVKTNGTTASSSQVGASRSLSNMSSSGINQELSRYPTEWNNDQRMAAAAPTHHEELLNPSVRTSPGAASNAISSKKAVERALEMLFDDDDEESMKLDFDLILSKNKIKKTSSSTDACSKITGVSPAKKPRKSKKSGVLASLSEPGWQLSGGPGVPDHHRVSLDGDYTLDGDGAKRNQYASSKINEMNASMLSRPSSCAQLQGQGAPPVPGENFRMMGGAGRLSPFGMSPRLDDRKLLLDYRRVMSGMEASNVHEVLETNYQMTQRNYASILNAMNRERTNNGASGGLPSGRPLQHLEKSGHNVHLREYDGGHFLVHSDPHRGELNNPEVYEEGTDDGGMPMDLESIRSSDLLTFNSLPMSTDHQQRGFNPESGAPNLHPSTDHQRQSTAVNGSLSATELSSSRGLPPRKPSAPRKPRVRKIKTTVSLPGSVDDVINSCALLPPVDRPPSRGVQEKSTELTALSDKELCVNNVVDATVERTINPRDVSSGDAGDLNLSSKREGGGAERDHSSGGPGVHDVVAKEGGEGTKTASPPRDLYTWMGSEPDLCGLGTDSGIASNTSLSVGSDLSEPERVSSTDNNVTCGGATDNNVTCGGGGGVGGGQSPSPSCERLSEPQVCEIDGSRRVMSSKTNDTNYCSLDVFAERTTTASHVHPTSKLPEYSKSFSDGAKTDVKEKAVFAVNKVPGGSRPGALPYASYDDRETKKYSLGRGAAGVSGTGCRPSAPSIGDTRCGGSTAGEAHRKRQNFRKRQPHFVGSDKGPRLPSGGLSRVGGGGVDMLSTHQMSQVVSRGSQRSVHSPALSASTPPYSCNAPFIASDANKTVSVPSYSRNAPFMAASADGGKTSLPATALSSSYNGSPPILASDYVNKITMPGGAASSSHSHSPPVLVSDPTKSSFNMSGCIKNSSVKGVRLSQSTCSSPRFHRPPSITSPALPRQLSESVQRAMLGAAPTLHAGVSSGVGKSQSSGDVSRPLHTARQVEGSDASTGIERLATGDGLKSVDEVRLVDGAPRLVDGAPRLVDGAPRLVDGAPGPVNALVAPRHVDGAPRSVDGAPQRPAGKSRSSTVLRITKTRSCERDPRSKDQWRVDPVVRGAGEGTNHRGGRVGDGAPPPLGGRNEGKETTLGNTEDAIGSNALAEIPRSVSRLASSLPTDTNDLPQGTKHPLGGVNDEHPPSDLHVSSILPSKQMLNNPTAPVVIERRAAPTLHTVNTARSSTNTAPKKSRLETPRAHPPIVHLPSGHGDGLRPNITSTLKRSVLPSSPSTRCVDGLSKEKRRRISSSSLVGGLRLQTKTSIKVLSSTALLKDGVDVGAPRSNNSVATGVTAVRKVTDALTESGAGARKRVVNGKKLPRNVVRTGDCVGGGTKLNVEVRNVKSDSDVRDVKCDSDVRDVGDVRSVKCDSDVKSVKCDDDVRDSGDRGSESVCDIGILKRENVNDCLKSDSDTKLGLKCDDEIRGLTRDTDKSRTSAPVTGDGADVTVESIIVTSLPSGSNGSSVSNETVCQDLKLSQGDLVSEAASDVKKNALESKSLVVSVVCKDTDTPVQVGTLDASDETPSCVRSSSKLHVPTDNGPVNAVTVACADDVVSPTTCLQPDTLSSTAPGVSQPAATDLEQQQHCSAPPLSPPPRGQQQQQPQELTTSTE